MTTYDTRKLRCHCCGKTSEQSVLTSSNSFGSRDLDQRPPEMMRSTMPSWLQECPFCGYVATDIGKDDATAHAFVGTPAFQALCADPSPDPISRRFLVRAAIDAHGADIESAFTQTLSAAWIADDASKPSDATALRLRAAAYVEGKAASLDTRLVLLDVLRRASEWSAAKTLADTLAADRPGHPYDAIVSFHHGKIGAKDSGRYTIADALADAPQPDNGGAANPERVKILVDHLRKMKDKTSRNT
jgi:hypothetical protein